MTRGAAVVVWVAMVLGCSGIPSSPPEPAPAVPAPVAPEPADDGGEDEGRSLLPKLDRSSEPRPTDCLLKIDELKPVLQKTQTGAARPVRVRREEGRIVEKVHFDDGAELRIVRSGCAHYGETWEMAPVDAAGGDLVQTAITAFARATTRDDAVWKLSLKKGAKLGDDGALPCGDAHCTVKLDGQVLTFAYDFAM